MWSDELGYDSGSSKTNGFVLLPTNLDSIATWLQCLDSLSSNNQCASPDFYRPYHFAMLAASMRANRKSYALPKSMEAYATRMHLWQAVERAPPVTVREFDSSGSFIPLTCLTESKEVDRIAEELSRMVQHQSGGETSVNGVYAALAEILNNCFDHSESGGDDFGLVCAQAWPNGSLAQVAIVDSGVGIRQTLKENSELAHRLARENACKMATEYAVSGKIGRGHSGYGLTLARDILRGNQGRLLVFSGYEAFYSGPDRSVSRRLTHRWRGTGIIFEWRTDKELSAKAVYNEWPDSWFNQEE